MRQSSKKMLADIEHHVVQTSRYTGKHQLGSRVMAAMAEIPREQFVPAEEKIIAYADSPLAIGHGQTISQPFIVALMTDLLALEPTDRVLEIGTGSGYQTAILAQLADSVYSMEVIPALAASAEQRLKQLHYKNIHIRTGNGYEGWPEQAPYDAIIVTAAAPYIPPALVAQLKPGSNMVIPVGRPHEIQKLLLVSRDEQNETTTKNILNVAFVPLVQDSKT